MKITHPVTGYYGRVRVGALRLDFVDGHATRSPLRDRYRKALVADGFTVTTNDGDEPGQHRPPADTPQDPPPGGDG